MASYMILTMVHLNAGYALRQAYLPRPHYTRFCSYFPLCLLLIEHVSYQIALVHSATLSK